MIVVTRENVTVESLRSIASKVEGYSLSPVFMLETTQSIRHTQLGGFGKSPKYLVRLTDNSKLSMVRSEDRDRYASGTLEELVHIIKENDYGMYDEERKILL